ncbi:unknown [Prevotella sp. CAG:732]|nr:unknown [Prevotella sp. CAG:732]
MFKVQFTRPMMTKHQIALNAVSNHLHQSLKYHLLLFHLDLLLLRYIHLFLSDWEILQEYLKKQKMILHSFLELYIFFSF